MSCPSFSKGKNLADDTCGAYARAEESEILECSSARSSSEGKNLADDTCGAYAEEVRNEALEGCDCQQSTISSSTWEDDGVEAHHDSSSTENDGAEAHVPCAYSEEDHIHFPSEDDHIHSSEDDHFSHSSEDDHFSHEDGEEGHVSSSTPGDDGWVSKIRKKSEEMPKRLKVSSGSKSCSIHRVPYSLRKHNEDAYNPQLISIGPFHYEERTYDRLGSMEEHKWNYLRDIISREPPGWLENCYVEIKMLEEDARNCYSQEIKVNIKDFDFLEMMVLDGCFIVEFLRRSWLCMSEHPRVFRNDVIIQLQWPARALWCDLLLLENQIPFFILQKLSDLMVPDLTVADLEDASVKFPPLVDMAVNFIFRPSNSTVVSNTNIQSETPILHLLHLLYVGWVPKPTGEPTATGDPSATEDITQSPEERKNRKGIRPRIPCASKLKEAGIRFKGMGDPSATEDTNQSPEERKNREGIRPRIPCLSKLKEAGIRFKRMGDPSATEDINQSPEERKNRKGIRPKGIRPRIPCASKLKEAGIRFKRMDGSYSLGIRFHNGVIEIPSIHVSDFTKKKFLNLIAFEQCYMHCSKLFTNFASFMDSLIDTAEDVEILHDKEIIYNALGDNGLVASEFSSIAREQSISYDPGYLADVCTDINEYSARFLPRSRASFVHDYCKNPWKLISVIAGGLLLLFTFTQTFFTAFPKFAYKNGDFTCSSP